MMKLTPQLHESLSIVLKRGVVIIKTEHNSEVLLRRDNLGRWLEKSLWNFKKKESDNGNIAYSGYLALVIRHAKHTC